MPARRGAGQPVGGSAGERVGGGGGHALVQVVHRPGGGERDLGGELARGLLLPQDRLDVPDRGGEGRLVPGRLVAAGLGAGREYLEPVGGTGVERVAEVDLTAGS